MSMKLLGSLVSFVMEKNLNFVGFEEHSGKVKRKISCNDDKGSALSLVSRTVFINSFSV